MAKRQTIIPQYGTVMKRGVLYYRTRIKDANGKLVAIYAKTPEELYNKETLALEQIPKRFNTWQAMKAARLPWTFMQRLSTTDQMSWSDQ